MAPSLYSRIELNLLPPELRPRPAVRYNALVNTAVIALTLVLIGVDIYSGVSKIMNLRQQKQSLEAEIERGEPIRQDYLALKEIESKLLDYGRIITMASADYIDMPVVMARLAQLLPDGVYLGKVTNQGSKSSGIQIAVELRSARRDEQLLIQTLNNLKQDKMFADCYMRTADLTEVPLGTIQGMYNAKWEIATPAKPEENQVQEYEFQLVLNLPRVLPVDGLSTSVDESQFFKGFELKPVAPLPEDGKAKEVPGSKTPPKAEGAPDNVTVEGTN